MHFQMPAQRIFHRDLPHRGQLLPFVMLLLLSRDLALQPL